MMRVPSSGSKIFAAVILSCLLMSCNEQQQTPAAGPAQKPQVSVMTLHPQSVAITAELPGRTVASLVAEVRPQVGGIIQKRLFREGSEVNAGDSLYQIDPATYRAAYDSAAADLQKAQAVLPSAQAKVDRYQDLIKQNAVSKQDLDDALASLAQAKADVASAQAALESARINLDFTMIRAPIAGRVDKSTLTEGALVTANQDTALTTIRTLDPINVDVTQSSTNLLNFRQAVADGRIRISGGNISVKLKLENGALYTQNGKLEFADSAVSETTGTFSVRAEFPNPERLLLPGMYVRALVEEGVAPNSFLVPQRAVTRNAKGEPVALFVDKDNKIEQRTLTVGQSVGNNWLVSAGVADGDRVVIEGSQFVRAGQEVEAVEATIDDTTGEVKERKQGFLLPEKRQRDFAALGLPSNIPAATGGHG
ncbi:efflux RND transporter periplasmic adaptor subunit [Aestuariivirga sp.]|uniref:efflux RND transporter periplasmic adaptor subunit n=1 Tax=Aestuariivirga sp. TaxID=2650926 RepID=UPI0039E25A0B